MEMADSRQLHRLIDYNQWADERILTAVDGLSHDELARSREAYFGTITQNLQHTVAAQRNWLARWKGMTPQYGEEFSRPWREIYAETHAGLRAFVAGLSDQTAGESLRFTDSRGNAHEMPLDQAIVHVVNHGTAHRAETGLLLERLGRSPGDLDYVLFCRLHP
jgi:uncharacterized damage-inducible protein DinB